MIKGADSKIGKKPSLTVVTSGDSPAPMLTAGAAVGLVCAVGVLLGGLPAHPFRKTAAAAEAPAVVKNLRRVNWEKSVMVSPQSSLKKTKP